MQKEIKCTYEEFLEIRKQMLLNIAKIHQQEGGWPYNLPSPNGYHARYMAEMIDGGHLTEENFRSNWHCRNLYTEWLTASFGKNYELQLKKYENLLNQPDAVSCLSRIQELSGRTYGWVWTKTREAVSKGKFVSFWVWTTAYNDTKSSWRHWWDALNSDKIFSVGTIVELRSKTNRNHVFEEHTHHYDADYKYLRSVNQSVMGAIKYNPVLVIGYDQRNPVQTYSYKKSQGSHRLVTVLPMGSTKTYYIPEQFLKVSRKKIIKEAQEK